jgi:hypothetical protein
MAVESEGPGTVVTGACGQADVSPLVQSPQSGWAGDGVVTAVAAL